MGKTRNAPIKEWTIPCLELQATVLAVRLSNSVLKDLDLQADETFFWSDSMTSQQYIKNQTRRFQTFVANRVAAIHESTSLEKWHHVQASMNLADEGSRSVTIEHFQPGCRWWSGPCFLWQPEQQWPNAQVEDIRSDDKEIRKPATIMFTTDTSQVDLLLQRYSSWSRLLRVMSWVLRFVKPLKKEKPERVVGRTLTLVELQRASEVITRLVQHQHFREEYMALKEGRQVKCSSSLATLSVILTDGIIRVGGRILRAPITFEAALPVILSKSSPVSVLIVCYYHVLGRADREHVLSVLRQRYWIGRS